MKRGGSGLHVALALALALSACGTARDSDVVLITVDTLRPDHLGIYGYPRATSPNIDRFFADASVYERAYSTTASTGPSVVSLLAGSLPHEHRVRLLYQLVPDDVSLVVDLLPENYQKAAFVSNIVLTDEALGIADRFDHYDDYVDQRESLRPIWERSAGRTTDTVLAWLREGRDHSRPLFLWVHYIDPHGPYRAPPTWKRTFSHSRQKVPIERRRLTSYMNDYGYDDAWRYVDHYDEEIAYTDAQVGRLLDGYGPRIEDSLVIFTADHGETMIEHDRWFTHGYHVVEPIVRVPLLVRGPGVPARRVSEPVHGTDVAPTVLRFTGADAPAPMPPVDLRTGEGLDPERPIFVEATSQLHQWRAVVQGDEKWLLQVRGPKRRVKKQHGERLSREGRAAGPVPWDDSAPAAEKLLDLVESDPDPSGVPRKYLHGLQLKAPKVDPRADAQMLEKLRSLGYAE